MYTLITGYKLQATSSAISHFLNGRMGEPNTVGYRHTQKMGMGTLYVMGEIVAPPKIPRTRVANGLGKGVSS